MSSVTIPMDTLFYSERMDGPGYLEYIYRKDDVHHERIAYITNIYANNNKPFWFTCVYGILEFSGPSVSSVKEQLFDAIAQGL